MTTKLEKPKSTRKPAKSQAGKNKKTPEQIQQKKLKYEQKKAQKLKESKEKAARKAAAGGPANKERFYCSNAQLMAELIKWRDSAEDPEDRIISEELGEMMIKIGDKVLNRSEFRNYDQALKEDMRSFFFYKIIKGLKNYDFQFENPFSFFTTTAFTAYLTILKRHYKQINIKKDLLQKLVSELETFPGMNSASSLAKCIKSYIDDADTVNDD